jgi:hypothetical protein
MSDEADVAQDHIEREEALRKKYRKLSRLEVEPTGECLNCDTPLANGRRWCDSYCQEDWRKRNK